MSLERWKIAEAESVPSLEGSTSAIAMRAGAAPPGSMAVPRMKSIRRNMRGPTGSARLVSGEGSKAMPEPPRYPKLDRLRNHRLLLLSLYTNPREDELDLRSGAEDGRQFRSERVKKHPLIAKGTPDPYVPRN